MFDDNDYGDYDNVYDNDYWNNLYEHDYTKSDRKFDSQRNLMYQQEITWINNFKKLKGSFLDVGCSYGTFFTFLPKEMYKVGIDVSTTVINDAKKLHPEFEFHKTFIKNFTEKKFDFIQFRGVLQHSIDPMLNLQSAIPLLNENGIIIVTSLPDFSCITNKIYKENFGFYLPRLSPHFFTRKSFESVLESLDLKIVRWESPYLNTPYAKFPNDLFSFIINKFQNKKNPPFFGNVKNYLISKI